jgi:hypothetical protein
LGVALPLAVIGPVVTVMLVGGAGVAVPVAVMAPVLTVTLVGITFGPVMGRVAVTGAVEFDGAFAPRSATAVQSMITRKAMRPWVTARRLIRLPFLKAGESHEFGIAQGSPTRASYTFGKTVTLTRIDAHIRRINGRTHYLRALQ